MIHPSLRQFWAYLGRSSFQVRASHEFIDGDWFESFRNAGISAKSPFKSLGSFSCAVPAGVSAASRRYCRNRMKQSASSLVMSSWTQFVVWLDSIWVMKDRAPGSSSDDFWIKVGWGRFDQTHDTSSFEVAMGTSEAMSHRTSRGPSQLSFPAGLHWSPWFWEGWWPSRALDFIQRCICYIYIYIFILIHAFDAPRQTFAVSTVCLLRRVHASMLHSPELNLKLTTSHSNNAPSTTLVTGTSEEPCT